tara:strand:- start:17 stop:589 length:573 start_codon:yes stop_codon:yes gene_type:complete
MKKLAFIDVETTGLRSDYHEIIEIYILKITGDKKESYEAKIKPVHLDRADKKALKINGYDPKKWKDAIDQRSAAIQISEFLKGGYRIVGHNPSFDMGFIRSLLEDHNCSTWIDYRYIDTIVLAIEHLEYCGLDSFSLSACRSFFGWDDNGSHTAKKDALDAFRLYEKLYRASPLKRLFWRYFPRLRRLTA